MFFSASGSSRNVSQIPMDWNITNTPVIPSVSGITLRALWQVPYGSPTLLKDAVGNYDLALVSGDPMELIVDTPNGKPTVYFDGTLKLTNEDLAQTNTAICLFFRVIDEAVSTPFAGFGDTAANMYYSYGNLYTLPNISGGQSFAPTGQYFVTAIGLGAFNFTYNNMNGLGYSSYSTPHTGFTLGAAHLDASPTMKGYFLGGFVFDHDLPNDVNLIPRLSELTAHWFSVGAVPAPTVGQKLLAVTGDSISVGSSLAHADTPPKQIETILGDWNVYSTGFPASTTQSAIDNDPYFIDAFYSATRGRSVAVLIGEPSNQILFGASGATALASVTQWAQDRLDIGLEAIACTVMERSDFDGSMNTAKADYNTLIRAAFNVATSSPYVFNPAPATTWATRMVDLHAIPGMTFHDGIHPDENGAVLLAREVATACEGWDASLAPIFSLPEKRFSIDQTLTLTCGTVGSAIRYTTDGSTPSGSSTLYSGPLTISVTTTVKAISITSGLPNSDVVSRTYTKTTTQRVSPAWVPLNPGSGSTVTGDEVTLGLYDSAGSAVVIDSTEDFSFVARVYAHPALYFGLRPNDDDVDWGDGKTLYGAMRFPLESPGNVTWSIERIDISGNVHSTLETGLTLPFWVRLRKVDDDMYFDRSPDGTTWTNESIRVDILHNITTCRMKLFTDAYGYLEAWLETLV